MPHATHAAPSALSPREREVVHLTAEGLSSRAIGTRLGISPRTVEVHRSHAMHKLGARNRVQLVLRFFFVGHSPQG